MPFGLHNVAQTFQRFIDLVVRGLHCTYVYINDVLILSWSAEEHMINPAKCQFGTSELEFLGHTVNTSGIYPGACDSNPNFCMSNHIHAPHCQASRVSRTSKFLLSLCSTLCNPLSMTI